jgi:hypothetical protein
VSKRRINGKKIASLLGKVAFVTTKASSEKHGGQNKQIILLTIKCFKSLCLRKKVYKREKDTNQLLSSWDSISKAAEAEGICEVKISRYIKSGVVFNNDYYYTTETI